MEDVLEVYNSPCKAGLRRLSIDVGPCQLLGDVYIPIPMNPGIVKKLDCEYKGAGTCLAFLAYDMDSGDRYVWINKTRIKKDYAIFIDWICTKEQYAQAKKIIMVQDNLNTHTFGSLYENLPLKRAAELRKRLKFHFTPKHGSWLNMAKIEFSALSRQCIDHRTQNENAGRRSTCLGKRAQ